MVEDRTAAKVKRVETYDCQLRVLVEEGGGGKGWKW